MYILKWRAFQKESAKSPSRPISNIKEEAVNNRVKKSKDNGDEIKVVMVSSIEHIATWSL